MLNNDEKNKSVEQIFHRETNNHMPVPKNIPRAQAVFHDAVIQRYPQATEPSERRQNRK